MPQEPKRRVSELKPAELRSIVREIQKLLWQNEYATDEQRSNGGSTRFWTDQKLWSLDTLKAISDVLEEHDLKPVNPTTIVGFKSVDEFTQRITDQFEPPATDPAWDAVLRKTPVEDDGLNDDLVNSEDPDDWIGGPNASP
jgi:hypothetical protein